MLLNNYKIIGFDADDTLWVNEPYYKEAEDNFCELLSGYLPKEKISSELFKTEMQNLELYGFGAKAFILSLIETALRISGNNLPPQIIVKIIKIGKALVNKDVELLEGVREVVKEFHSRGARLIIATKGDLLDQERKLRKSGIGKYFHHVEVMSDKKEENYKKLFNHLDITPGDFLMIGNSMKSDIIPVLNLGAAAIHIPYHTNWEYENHSSGMKSSRNFRKIDNIYELLKLTEE